jgi:hypothetical protein
MSYPTELANIVANEAITAVGSLMHYELVNTLTCSLVYGMLSVHISSYIIKFKISLSYL